MPLPPITHPTAAHELARELRGLATLLTRHPDPQVAGAAAPSVAIAADVIERLANELLWVGTNGDEFGELLVAAHAWAQCELDAYGPGPDGGNARRHAETARALILGLKLLAHLERLTRAVVARS